MLDFHITLEAHNPARRCLRQLHVKAGTDLFADILRIPLEVAWYGGGRHPVEVVTGAGSWYRSGEGLVPVRWVFVHDTTGAHLAEYLIGTDIDMTPRTLIEEYTGRWSNVPLLMFGAIAAPELSDTCGYLRRDGFYSLGAGTPVRR